MPRAHCSAVYNTCFHELDYSLDAVSCSVLHKSLHKSRLWSCHAECNCSVCTSLCGFLTAAPYPSRTRPDDHRFSHVGSTPVASFQRPRNALHVSSRSLSSSMP
ncbi:unnamed protein product [Ectocarpus sp. 12 AP-2014]